MQGTQFESNTHMRSSEVLVPSKTAVLTSWHAAWKTLCWLGPATAMMATGSPEGPTAGPRESSTWRLHPVAARAALMFLPACGAVAKAETVGSCVREGAWRRVGATDLAWSPRAKYTHVRTTASLKQPQAKTTATANALGKEATTAHHHEQDVVGTFPMTWPR